VQKCPVLNKKKCERQERKRGQGDSGSRGTSQLPPGAEVRGSEGCNWGGFWVGCEFFLMVEGGDVLEQTPLPYSFVSSVEAQVGKPPLLCSAVRLEREQPCYPVWRRAIRPLPKPPLGNQNWTQSPGLFCGRSAVFRCGLRVPPTDSWVGSLVLSVLVGDGKEPLILGSPYAMGAAALEGLRPLSSHRASCGGASLTSEAPSGSLSADKISYCHVPENCLTLNFQPSKL
jgi:hypothetical protein